MHEYNNDLFWHALNYRGAALNPDQSVSQLLWLELVACVNRLIEDGLPIDESGKQVQ